LWENTREKALFKKRAHDNKKEYDASSGENFSLFLFLFLVLARRRRRKSFGG
jgi:hypothetical protein